MNVLESKHLIAKFVFRVRWARAFLLAASKR